MAFIFSWNIWIISMIHFKQNGYNWYKKINIEKI